MIGYQSSNNEATGAPVVWLESIMRNALSIRPIVLLAFFGLS